MSHFSNLCRSPATGLLACLLLGACVPPGAPRPIPEPEALVEDVAAARRVLDEQREELRAQRRGSPAARARRMVALGMWDEAEALLERSAGAEARVAEAELRLAQHRYPVAAALVDAVLRAEPSHRAARVLRARLQVQAWELPAAAATLEGLLRERPRDHAATLLLGRVRLLEKRYDEALRLAGQVQAASPRSAEAHRLEADAHFWNQDPALAEAALARALALDPFDADARFGYGYAIWRRVDATRLGEMAEQWNLALELDPLHYQTHWHFGNGHTHLTYADYAQPSDSTVRARLAEADSLVAAGRVTDAIGLARAIGLDHPESVLPAMLRASAFYLAREVDRPASLDSAQAIFRSVLEQRPNYGPAHNGLAAVIKQRQVEVLASYDSLEAGIAGTPTPPDPALRAVFPDLDYYPGDRVEEMVRRQLGPSAAFLPMLRRQGRRFRIPPLHQDLAAAMGDPYFRTATTFDNRQWMDIRGVGSGAAGIEYVERGAFQERNVLLHEFVHLFHDLVLTDAESRRVRRLYHDAVRDGRTLDYYAANNEMEFLAQAYPAFLSPVKVHPLNHKAMNTHDDLRRTDPATHAWVDSLVARQQAYLAGDAAALDGNWAQVYVNLSEEARRESGGSREEPLRRAAALLDTALVRSPDYLPALLSYAALQRQQGRFEQADAWLARAEGLDPGYAPIQRERAGLVGARARAGGGDAGAALERQAELYHRALQLETDLALRARLSRELWELYHAHARVPEAIRVAEEYAVAAPTISTYLRDRHDEASVFAHRLRAAVGYAGESLDFFGELLRRRPQDYQLRARFADALLAAGRPEEAAAVLEDARRVLRAADREDATVLSRLAEIRLLQGDSAAARSALEPVLAGRAREDARELRLVRVLLALGQTTEAHRRLAEHPAPESALARAELAYTRGWLAEWRGDEESAERSFRAALADDPYHADARVRLVVLLRGAGRDREAGELVSSAEALPLPLGPDFVRALEAARPQS